jgi:shikimate dehydrogenase
MRKFGLIGYPLGHSFSKNYFADKFLREHITDCSYENYPLTDLTRIQKLINDEHDLCGLNVTIPYKSDIIRFLDEIETEAEEVGAVNVLKIRRLDRGIKLAGYNSDVTGIRDSLLPYINSNIRNAMVLGTGGSSRAVCHVLKKLGLGITLVSRKRKPGILGYSDINSGMIKNTDIIINTTPLGMFPDTESRPDINYVMLDKTHILFDLVYNPELTSFLKMGKEQGCTTISGIKMLHSQAEKAWEIWNDENL